MFLKDYPLNNKDKYYLLIVFLFSFITIYEMIDWHLAGGMSDPDKAIYLIDALKFAGMDYYNICQPQDIYYSPVICFLTSLLFRLGFVNLQSLLFVTAVFGVICEIGLYVFLRYRFSSLLSLTGVVIFGSLFVVLMNIGSGGIDIPSIAISIWTIIFFIIAIEKNPKYFILIVPLLVLAFFTRYTAGFIILVLFVYYVISKGIGENIDLLFTDRKLFKEKLINYLKTDEAKYIIISIFLGLIIAGIICYYILYQGGYLTFFEQTSGTLNGNNFSPGGADANNSRLYYLRNLPNILFDEYQILDSTLAYLLISILGIGCLLKIKNNFSNIKSMKLSFNNKNLNLFSYIIFILSIIGIMIGFWLRNHLMANICVLIAVIILYYLFNYDNEKDSRFFILNLSWLMITFIFASLYNVKIPRYFLPILPSFIFFLILALEEILTELGKIFNFANNEKIEDGSFNWKYNIIPIILILTLVITTLMFVVPLSDIGENHHTALNDVTDYIVNHDPDYHSKEIVAYDNYFMLVKWYIKINGTKLRFFETDKIDDMNASYVIIDHDYDFKNYHKIFKSKEMHLFAHN